MMRNVHSAAGCHLTIMLTLVSAVNSVMAEDISPKMFSLTDTDGQAVRIAPNDQAALTVVCFLGTECLMATNRTF